MSNILSSQRKRKWIVFNLDKDIPLKFLLFDFFGDILGFAKPNTNTVSTQCPKTFL